VAHSRVSLAGQQVVLGGLRVADPGRPAESLMEADCCELDFAAGRLLLVATPRGLRLKFTADAGTSWALYASKIHEVALVGSGPNVIIEVVFKHPGEPVGIRTIVGPKGRMGEICRLLGYPIV
jgi:hypothetical protein